MLGQCDGVAPSCTACVKQGRAALCSLRKENLGKDRDYVTFLEKKLQHLQGQYSQLSGSGESPDHVQFQNPVSAEGNGEY